MKQSLIQIVKHFLPEAVVVVIKNWRKERRQQKRYEINKGENVLSRIELFGQSFSIYLNPYLNGGVDDDIYRTGVWEPEIAELVKQYLPQGGTFIDIGANIGFHSLFAASVTGESGVVLSFEPLPRLQQQQQASIEKNGFKNVHIEPVALGSTPGVATLSLVEENVGASSLQNVAGDRVVGNTVEVPVQTLDTYLSKITRLDLIKIDIEGSEFEALKGGEEILRTFKPVIILEFSPHVYEKDYIGKSVELYDFLTGLGYIITDIEKRVPDVKQSLQEGKFAELHTNLLCLPVN